MSDRHDVIVVGAGPVGLSLALALVRGGAQVLVLEKNAATAEHSRAPAIWPATQAFLGRLGVMGAFLDEGIAERRLQLWDADRGRALLALPVEELAGETPYPQLLILPQSRTERLLCEAIREAPGAEIRFSSEVEALRRDGSEVEVRYRTASGEHHARATFVAGCDGARSTVRGQIGGSLEGITYPFKVSLADFAVRGDEALPAPRLTTRPDLAVAIRMRAGLWRLILPFSGEADGARFQARLDSSLAALFPGLACEEVWRSDFRLHRRISSTWVDGQVVLAGDAAHLNSPVGAEGMNAGMLDAAALAETLVAALASGAPADLAGYARRRRAAIEGRVNPFTDRLTRVLFAWRGRLIRPVLGLAALALRIGPLRRKALRRLALLDSV